MKGYRSSTTLLGLPLFHFAVGTLEQGAYRRGIACGWIAVGDVAFGLVAAGGLACGGIAVGGVALGAIVFAGLGVGALALAGAAFGYVALGGAAVAWHAALGGLAVAKDYALGGLAIAAEANTRAAEAFFGEDPFLSGAQWLMDRAQWLLLLVAIPVLIALKRRGSGKRARGG